MSKIPLSKYCSATIDSITGTCVITKNTWSGVRRAFQCSEEEMRDFVAHSLIIQQKTRRYELYTHLYRQGKMTKSQVMMKARKHDSMQKVGERNGVTVSLFAKKKESDSDEDSDDCEGVIDVTHNIYVNLRINKIDHFAGMEFGLPTEALTITHMEYVKLNDVMKKYLHKKGIEVEEKAPPHAEVLSDIDDDDEDEEAVMMPMRKGKQAVNKVAAGTTKRGSQEPIIQRRVKKQRGVKRGRKQRGQAAEDDDEEDCANLHVCKCKDCEAKVAAKTVKK